MARRDDERREALERAALRDLRDVCNRWVSDLGEGTRLRGAFLEVHNHSSRILAGLSDPEKNEDNPRPGPHLVVGGR